MTPACPLRSNEVTTASPDFGHLGHSSRRRRTATRPRRNRGARDFMPSVLETDADSALLTAPTFGHTKHKGGFMRFHRRGRAAARTEWRLMTDTHSLVKLRLHFNGPGD